jgi:hypothetical protein
MGLAILLGLFALIAGVLLLKWYADADVKTLKKSVRWAGVTLLVLIILVLAATGRLGVAFAAFIGFLAWVWRVFNMVQMGRQMGGMFSGFAFGRGFSGGGGRGNSSQVESDFLSMQLDLSTGEMDGEVRRGIFQGRRLGELSREDLNLLLNEVQIDGDSARLLEAYMDRVHPDWRDDSEGAGGESRSAATQSGLMTKDEARRVLGVGADAGEKDIKAAYKRLMSQLHPDRGGSDYLAAKVNQAKDVLLKTR